MSSSINANLLRALLGFTFSSLSFSVLRVLLGSTHLVSIMVAAALVSHRSLPPVSCLPFLFSFPFLSEPSVSGLSGSLQVSLSPLLFFSVFLNSLKLQYAGMKDQSCLPKPLDCFILLFSLLLAFFFLSSFSGNFSLYLFLFSLCAHLFGGIQLPLPFRFEYRRERQEVWRSNDIPLFCTGGYTLVLTDCPHRHSTCHVWTHTRL